ncbi:hypothetical protein [Arsenicibacter rosenii]|uniref:Uncharacterized protein n=1 Tax=Arsenicibacter rosenii TaxID=1750698 RepID=A0A1S2VS53_9BACT|nr:hypothetical protein [Arsenicibacter rosenii]OIN61165.1 hypothetical protein BLX24_03645 [Arsenicibacter rosenii]
MKKFWISEREYHVADSWQECTPEQLKNGLLLQLSASVEKHELRKAHYTVMMLRILSDCQVKQLSQLNGEQLYRLKKLVKWAFETPVTSQPFGHFTLNGKDYLLPAEGFANTSAIELAMANIYYLQFAKGHKEAALKLVATLCRPQRTDIKSFRRSVKWNGDAREEYNSVLADERAAEFSKLHFGVVIAVVQYFESLNRSFLERYGEVFGGDPEEKAPPLYKNGEGWLTCLEQVAELGTHGQFQQVCAENCHTIWLYLKHRTLKRNSANQVNV